jgi:ankyrin repeat protein
MFTMNFNGARAALMVILCCTYLGCSRNPTAGRAGKYFSDPQMVALAEVVSQGDVQQIDKLVAQGADVNARGKDGLTLLMWALISENKASFKRLLEHGADPNLYIAGHYLAGFHTVTKATAGIGNSSEWLEMALQHGGDPNLVTSITPKDTETPIFAAIESRRKQNLDLLIKAGADLNHQDHRGTTPMVYAAGMMYYDSAYYLLEAGADFRIMERNGFDVACEAVETTVDPRSDLERWRQKLLNALNAKGVDLAAAKQKRWKLDHRPPPKMEDLNL